MSFMTFVKRITTPAAPAVNQVKVYVRNDGLLYTMDEDGYEHLIGVKTGTATIDFGGAPGVNNCTLTVTGQDGILAGSSVSAFMMAEATVDHSIDEHTIAPVKITCGNIVAATGFDIIAASEWLLTGTFKVRWTWT